MFKAVLWDFGGVITSSPFEAFNRFEANNNLPSDIIRSINSTNPDTNAWALLESSAISVDEFDALFASEALDKGHNIRGKQVLALLSGDIRPEMVKALRLIKETRSVGCITNNVNTGAGPGMAKSESKAEAMLTSCRCLRLLLSPARLECENLIRKFMNLPVKKWLSNHLKPFTLMTWVST